VLRKIFGSFKRENVEGQYTRLHNEEHRNLCISLNIIRVMTLRRMRSVGYEAEIGDRRNAYNILVGKSEGKRLLGRPRCRWEVIIGMDLTETMWQDKDWIHSAQNRDNW
jgi:hypothetical protein